MAALAGVRLLTLAQNVPGPVAVARLVAHGAAATKVEPPSGDPLGTICPAWYHQLHAGIAVVSLDLKSATGRLDLDRRLTDADVLLTSYRPSALERLGLGRARLAERFPTLRVVSIVGDTAEPERPGHDVTYQAEAGLIRDRLPTTLLADMAGAERVVTSVLLVLRSTPGARVEVGLRDVVNSLRAPFDHGLTSPGGLLGGGLAAYGVYATRDGFVAVAALEPHFRSKVYEALGLPLDAPLDDILASRTSAEWTAFAREHDLPLAIVRQPD